MVLAALVGASCTSTTSTRTYLVITRTNTIVTDKNTTLRVTAR